MIFRRWIPVAALAGLAMLAAFILASATGYPMRKLDFGIYFLLVVSVVGLIWVIQFLLYLFRLWRADVRSPLAAMRADCRNAVPNLLSGTVGIVLLSIYLQSLNMAKVMITAVVPFWADAPLLAFDLMLFGDFQVIARVLRPAMPAIDGFYWSWHLINLAGITWVLHWRSRQGQLLVIAYMLTWAIGMIFAYLGSSAGPIFTGAFDPSLAPRSIQAVSADLWSNHISQGAMIGSGISAFPSMHVAIAAWFAFVLREKGLEWLGWAYAFAIFVCSVLVGWHYTLDGIAGAAIAWLAYQLAATPVRGGMPLPVTRPVPTIGSQSPLP